MASDPGFLQTVDTGPSGVPGLLEDRPSSSLLSNYHCLYRVEEIHSLKYDLFQPEGSSPMKPTERNKGKQRSWWLGTPNFDLREGKPSTTACHHLTLYS